MYLLESKIEFKIEWSSVSDSSCLSEWWLAIDTAAANRSRFCSINLRLLSSFFKTFASDIFFWTVSKSVISSSANNEIEDIESKADIELDSEFSGDEVNEVSSMHFTGILYKLFKNFNLVLT